MKKHARHQNRLADWRQAFAIVFAVLVLLACKISEEIQIEKNGSGFHRAELTLVGGEKELLPAIREELAKKPQVKIVNEGPRGDDYVIIVEQEFATIEELNDNTSSYSWSESQDGSFARRAQLTLNNRPNNEPGLTEHIVAISMPGKIVQSIGGEVSGNVVTWDRLAAGSRGRLEVEARYLALQPGLANKLWFGGIGLLVGVSALVMVRIRRRRKG